MGGGFEGCEVGSGLAGEGGVEYDQNIFRVIKKRPRGMCSKDRARRTRGAGYGSNLTLWCLESRQTEQEPRSNRRIKYITLTGLGSPRVAASACHGAAVWASLDEHMIMVEISI